MEVGWGWGEGRGGGLASSHSSKASLIPPSLSPSLIPPIYVSRISPCSSSSGEKLLTPLIDSF